MSRSLRNPRRRTFGTVTLSAVLFTTVVACGGDDAAPPAASKPSSSAPATAAFPFTVKNCDTDLTFTGPPRRVVLLGADAVNMLDLVGGLDRVVAKTGDFPKPYFNDTVQRRLDAIPTIETSRTSTGGVELSAEELIATKADLVIGYETETVTRTALSAANVKLYVVPAFCKTGAPGAGEPVSFERIYDQMRFYGKLFDAGTKAEGAIADLQARVKAVSVAPSGRKAATLYIPSDASAVYAYGPASMAHPQMETVGLRNVFDDLKERVAEISVEELVSRNPDVLVLLYGESDAKPADIEAIVRRLPGANTIKAVANNQIHTQLFSFTDPPNPLSVTGLEQIARRFAA